jgi:hypothetical protein
MPIDGHAGVIFQHDNARRPHIPQITRTFLHWPARSSDLNPIEHVWDKMGRRLRRFPQQANSLEKLRRHLQQACDEIPQNRSIILFGTCSS